MGVSPPSVAIELAELIKEARGVSVFKSISGDSLMLPMAFSIMSIIASLEEKKSE